MSEWTPLSRDNDLERADDLLGQADALLRRHRGEPGTAAQSAAHAHDPDPAFDEDDLPILTDIVDDLDLPQGWPEHKAVDTVVASPPHAPPARMDAGPAPEPDAHRAAVAQHLAERLVELDTEIAREVADWVAVEFQQVLDRELDRLGERLHAEMLAHLRATLLPALSGRVSRLLDDGITSNDAPDRA